MSAPRKRGAPTVTPAAPVSDQRAEVVAWLRANDWRYTKAAKHFDLPADTVREWGRAARSGAAPEPPQAPPLARAREDAPEADVAPGDSYSLQMGRREQLEFELREVQALIVKKRDDPRSSTAVQKYMDMRNKLGAELAALNEAAANAPEDLGGLDDETFMRDLAAEAEAMPEPHLRRLVDVYLVRHRMMLVRDLSKVEIIGAEDADPDA